MTQYARYAKRLLGVEQDLGSISTALSGTDFFFHSESVAGVHCWDIAGILQCSAPSSIFSYFPFGDQGPVVRMLVSTNLGLNFNRRFFKLPWIILSILILSFFKL